MGLVGLVVLVVLVVLFIFFLLLLLLLLITSFFMYISAAIRDLYENDRSSDHSKARKLKFGVQISTLYLYCGSSYARFREVIILLHSLTFYSVFFFLLLFPLWLELYCTVL